MCHHTLPRSALSSLRSLCALDLSSNDVRDALEGGFSQAPCGGGGGGGAITSEIGGGDGIIAAMPELRSLNLCGVASHNRLGRELPREIWAHRALRQLNLSYCGIEVLPEAIGQLVLMEELRCDGNRYVTRQLKTIY